MNHTNLKCLGRKVCGLLLFVMFALSSSTASDRYSDEAQRRASQDLAQRSLEESARQAAAAAEQAQEAEAERARASARQAQRFRQAMRAAMINQYLAPCREYARDLDACVWIEKPGTGHSQAQNSQSQPRNTKNSTSNKFFY